MMASPYVRPFQEEVRAWEQRLSLISEAIEVRAPYAKKHCCQIRWPCYILSSTSWHRPALP